MLSAAQLYRALLEAYGRPRWWSFDPFTVMVQAVLVQNCAWKTVERTCAAWEERLTPLRALQMPEEELRVRIRPCGFAARKAQTIRALAQWFQGQGCDRARLRRRDAEALRRELLAHRGVGRETADVILLYAFFQPVFVVDAYTRRLLQRLGGDFADDAAVRAYFAATLPAEPALCGALHWLLLEHAIAACRKRPACAACPLRAHCPAAENVFYE